MPVRVRRSRGPTDARSPKAEAGRSTTLGASMRMIDRITYPKCPGPENGWVARSVEPPARATADAVPLPDMSQPALAPNTPTRCSTAAQQVREPRISFASVRDAGRHHPVFATLANMARSSSERVAGTRGGLCTHSTPTHRVVASRRTADVRKIKEIIRLFGLQRHRSSIVLPTLHVYHNTRRPKFTRKQPNPRRSVVSKAK